MYPEEAPVMRGALLVSALSLILLVGCGGGTTANNSAPAFDETASTPASSPAPSPPPSPVLSLGVTPLAPSMAAGTALRLVATAVYPDGLTRDVSGEVAWGSSDSRVVSVSPQGLARGLSPGSADVSAAFGGAVDRIAVVVSGAHLQSLQVSAASLSMAQATEQQLTAIGVFDDLSTQDLTDQVSWSTSSEEVTVSADGVVHAARPDPDALVFARFGGVTGSATLAVTSATLESIDVTPPYKELPPLTEQRYTATGQFSDGSVQDLTSTARWSSSSTAIASITPAGGRLAALKNGEATVTARHGSVTGNALVFVVAPRLVSLVVDPGRTVVARGTQLRLRAVGRYSNSTTRDLTDVVTWLSSGPEVRVSNADGSRGQVLGVDRGSATVSARFAGLTGRSTLTVTPAILQQITVSPSPSPLPAGLQRQFTATGRFSDGRTQDLTDIASWSSSSASATVTSPGGRVTAVRPGGALIRASLQAVSGTSGVLVTAPVLRSIVMEPASPTTIAIGGSQAFKLTATWSDGESGDVTEQAVWSVSSPKVEISNAAGSRGVAFGLSQVENATVSGQFQGAAATGQISVVGADPFVYVSSAARGTVAAYTISASGGLVPVDGSPFAAGAQARSVSASPDARFLYLGGDRAILGFAISPYDGILVPLSGSPFAVGRTPYALTAAANGALYMTDPVSLSMFGVDPFLGDLTLEGSTPVTPSSFGVTVDASRRYVYVANRDPNDVFGFVGGTLAACPGSPFAAGGLPLGLAASPRGTVYVANNGGSISGYAVNPASGTLTPLPGSPYAAGAATVAVAVSPTGRVVYSVNQGGRFPAIGSYLVEPDGRLDSVAFAQVDDGPTSVAVDPTGRFVYVTCADTSTICAFSTDPQTGTMTPLPDSPIPTQTGPDRIVVVH
jgi:6-phosphogluconolactonase (cycloisomerase 2 family)